MASQQNLVDKVMSGEGTANLKLTQGSILDVQSKIRITDDASKTCSARIYQGIGILGINGDYLHIEMESLTGPKDHTGRRRMVTGQIPLKKVEDVDYTGAYRLN